VLFTLFLFPSSRCAFSFNAAFAAVYRAPAFSFNAASESIYCVPFSLFALHILFHAAFGRVYVLAFFSPSLYTFYFMPRSGESLMRLLLSLFALHILFHAAFGRVSLAPLFFCPRVLHFVSYCSRDAHVFGPTCLLYLDARGNTVGQGLVPPAFTRRFGGESLCVGYLCWLHYC